MIPKVAVLSGFGINCEPETMAVFEMAGAEASKIHVNRLVSGELNLDDYHIMAIPGGFSFGDHLGSGRLMGNRLRFGLREQVRNFVKSGKPVIGICNGFQILIETSLLDGALIRNNSLSFICKDVHIKTENHSSVFTNKTKILRMPIAHNEGNYFASDETLKKIIDNDQVAFKYCNENGEVNLESNPNGSLENIAGILNNKKNVLGLMPHPERAAEQALGCDDGKYIFESVLS